MPSRSSSAAIDYTLTAYAQGHMNDVSKTLQLQERLCPVVSVPGAVGTFFKFNDENSFQTYNTERALGGDPNRIHFGAGKANYNCEPQALAVTIDDHERKLVGNDPGALQLLSQGKIKSLINSIALSSAKKRVDFVLANTTALEDVGNWSNPDVDPIDQIDQVIDDLSVICGSEEHIKVTMSRTAWRTIRNHPKVKQRYKGVQLPAVTVGQVQEMLASPVDIGIFAISYNTKKVGVEPEKARMLDGVVLVHYSLPSITQYDPSAFKCFVAGPNNVQAVRTAVAPNGLYEEHFVDWTEDLQKTSDKAMVRINIS